MDQKWLKEIYGYIMHFWVFLQLAGKFSCTQCHEDLRKAVISWDIVSSKEKKDIPSNSSADGTSGTPANSNDASYKIREIDDKSL